MTIPDIALYLTCIIAGAFFGAWVAIHIAIHRSGEMADRGERG